MKTFLLALLISFQSMAACDWSTVFKDKQYNYYVYSAECHLEVGRLVKEEKQRDEQVKELKTTIQLKDLALDKADERVMRWREESYKQNDALNRQYNASQYNKWLYFGLGVAMAGFSVWGAGQLK